MTPELSVLMAAADAAKQHLIIRVNANETAAQLAAQAKARHEEWYALVLEATDDLAKARAAIDAALDVDYGRPTAPVADQEPIILQMQPAALPSEPEPVAAPIVASSVDVVMAAVEIPANLQ